MSIYILKYFLMLGYRQELGCFGQKKNAATIGLQRKLKQTVGDLLV